jgi:hypothetical protein
MGNNPIVLIGAGCIADFRDVSKLGIWESPLGDPESFDALRLFPERSAAFRTSTMIEDELQHAQKRGFEARIFTLGDNWYLTGDRTDYFNKTWGRLGKNIIDPVIGDHDRYYMPPSGNHFTGPTAPHYASYFLGRTDKNDDGIYYYRKDIPESPWVLIMLDSTFYSDSNSFMNDETGEVWSRWYDGQSAWLDAQLKDCDSKNKSVIAMWHQPLFPSLQGRDGWKRYSKMIPIWNKLVGYGASLVITAHDHFFEESLPMKENLENPGLGDRGLVQLIVGTGGGFPSRRVDRKPEDTYANHINSVYGVLVLELSPTDPPQGTWRFRGVSYSYAFANMPDQEFTISGKIAGRPPKQIRA